MYDGNPHLLVCTAMITLIGRKLPLCLVQAIQPTLQSSQVAQQAVAKRSIDQSWAPNLHSHTTACYILHNTQNFDCCNLTSGIMMPAYTQHSWLFCSCLFVWGGDCVFFFFFNTRKDNDLSCLPFNLLSKFIKPKITSVLLSLVHVFLEGQCQIK